MFAGYPHLLAAARRLQWDADAIDLTADAPALAAAPPHVAARIRRLVGGFCVAETAVAAHLAPFGTAATDPDARAAFAMQETDERRHARFFARVASEVCGIDPHAEARALAGPEIVALFDDDLPALAGRLAAGDADLADAVGLYHLVLEGIVFAVGQGALLDELDRLTEPLRGTREGVARVQADERWHVGLGVLALTERARPVDVSDAARRAATAWGEEIATPDRLARVLAAHDRRLRFLPEGYAPPSRSRGLRRELGSSGALRA